jgi:hypothetical protein
MIYLLKQITVSYAIHYSYFMLIFRGPKLNRTVQNCLLTRKKPAQFSVTKFMPSF